MTVSYTGNVANASRFGVFTGILTLWRGSVYKLVYKELMAFLSVYFFLNIFYRTVLTTPGMEYYRHIFEGLKAYCAIQMSSIPMTFVLGFYVSLIVKRWWDQYNLLPWPDSMAIYIVGLLQDQDERGRLMRRNIMRYVLLSYVITLRRVSQRVKKRFPTIDHVIEAGLMKSEELKCMEALNDKYSGSKWWMPLVWATNIVVRARQENKIKSDPGVQTLLSELSRIRHGLTKVQHYDTLSVPLVYTQVVALAVYSYFLAALMGGQWVSPADPKDYAATYKLPTFDTSNSNPDSKYHSIDLYYPFFLTLQFAFYVGWLKVAETLINPFGEDDDDFELSWLIDRHVKVSYMIVDDMHHNNTPELLRDVYWNQVVPPTLPYTEETAHYRKDEPRGSTEQKDEDIYYTKSQMNYSLFKPELRSSKTELANEPSSDYEAVDTNLIGWWKNKIRKSQIRRSLRSLSSLGPHSSTANGGPPNPNSQQRRRSSKSGGGIYNRLMNAASRSRKDSLSSITSVMAEDSIRSQADIDSDLKLIYGDARIRTIPNSASAPQLPAPNSSKPGELDTDLLVDKLRNMSHLSTITENSPYSTHMGSRRNSHYPSAIGIFDTVAETKDENMSSAENEVKSEGNSDRMAKENSKSEPKKPIISGNESDSPYYPMGSDATSRPFTPRFTIEEIGEVSSCYEPIHYPPIMVRPNASLVRPSPVVPKRMARIEPIDGIIDKKYPENPSEKLTISPVDSVPDKLVSQGLEEEEEVFEEIEVAKDHVKDEKDARSAFENASTYYV